MQERKGEGRWETALHQVNNPFSSAASVPIGPEDTKRLLAAVCALDAPDRELLQFD
jgi:hypothetical protein